ncbi:MAG TPA: fibronectin type III domain-containing protein [Spirochaetota bacterium]|nr:fibronectin type III domain-containing protein [Spirochaetota bacterium]HQO02811.1 fibronectin type III domain-containing protein [Spirochaetota bacterium]HQP48380.1 fibronectin type III domain-containing protein [Spirochaetota bacterium]
MKTRIGMMCVCVLCAVSGTGSLFGEYVFLKDGQIREGTIVSENAASVVLRKADKKREVIQRRDIMRLLYTELYMGRVYVQKADGKGVVGYMVDEDRKTYTFRKELYRPEEFTLKREEVLFIARRNPSGLQGEPETDRIRLKWQPPYNQVDTYKIYLKGPADPKFRVVDDTGARRFTVEDLKSNTEYKLYVTAVAREGDESTPSNEITVKTKNIPPPAPENVRLQKGDTGHVRGDTAGKKILQWDPVRDVDGTVKEYRVYNNNSNPPVRIGTVRETVFEIPPGLDEKDIAVFSVDDMGYQSGGYGSLPLSAGFVLEFSGWYILPRGALGDLIGSGYGGLGKLMFPDVFISHLSIGITGGYWIFSGEHEDVDSSYIVPALVSCGYRFALFGGLSLVPEVNGGYAYIGIKYKKYDMTTILRENSEKSAFEPMALGALTLAYSINGMMHVFAGGGYGVLFESSGLQKMITFSVGLNVMF